MSIRNCVLTLCALLLSACMSYTPTTPKPQSDSAPATSQALRLKLERQPDPEVVPVKRGKRGNGPVYTVLGRSYRVMTDARGFTQQGTASWYGAKFHGRLTSSGEPFDMYKLSAAHRHLPLPTFVRVTNMRNGKQTIVRVNDRGPFHSERIIDLSYGAAVKLGFQESGTAPVKIEVVEPRPEPSRFLVQVGAFAQLDNADRNAARIKGLTGLRPVVLRTSRDSLYRLQLGPVPDGPELERVKALLQTADFGPPSLIPVSGG